MPGMSQADIEILRDQYEAVNERDWKRAMSHYAEDVVLSVPPGETGLNAFEPGTVEGKEAVGAWFGDWFGTFERDYRFVIEEIEDLGGVIFMRASHGGHGRLSGAAVHGENAYLYRLREGKIVWLGFYGTREEALAAAEAEA